MLVPLRKAFAFLACVALVFALTGSAALLVGCRRDTQDRIEDVGEDIQEGAEDAAEEAEDALEDIEEELQ